MFMFLVQLSIYGDMKGIYVLVGWRGALGRSSSFLGLESYFNTSLCQICVFMDLSPMRQ